MLCSGWLELAKALPYFDEITPYVRLDSHNTTDPLLPISRTNRKDSIAVTMSQIGMNIENFLRLLLVLYDGGNKRPSVNAVPVPYRKRAPEHNQY